MSLVQDLRYAVRVLMKAPGFAFAAVLLLSIGMAAAPAVFSFANALFWKPIHAPGSNRLVRIFVKEQGSLGGEFSYPEFRELRDHATTFDAIAAEYPTAPLNVTADNESLAHNGAVVTANYFSLVGVSPLRGRFFLPEEDAVADRNPVAVISARMWRSRFGSEPSTLGREISINGVAFRVVGIAPENFFGDEPGIAATEIWIPTAMLRVGYRWCDAYANVECSPLHLLARLTSARNASAAQMETNAIATAQRLPAVRDAKQLVVLPAIGVRPEEQMELAPQVRLLMALALTLLLIACANLAGLLLTRGVARRREVAVRLALGARPGRIVRQLLTENLLLALAGGGLGLILGFWVRDLFVSLYTLQSEGGNAFYNVAVDWRMLAFSAGAALATGMLFGLLPAIRAVRCEMLDDLKSGGAAIGSPRSGRMRDLLAATQVSLGLVLLVAAGLMVHSAQHILGDANFDPSHVVLLRLRPRLVKYTPIQAEVFYHAIEERLPAVSAVQAVGFGIGGNGLLWTEHSGPAMRLTGANQADADVRVLPVNNTFFETLRIPLLQGRMFTQQDQPGGEHVLVVNQAAARQFWPQASAVGQMLTLSGQPYRVIGVVADIGLRNLRESAAPQMYSAFWQNNPGLQGDIRMAVRVQGNTGEALTRLRQAIAAADPRVPVSEEMLLVDQVKSEYSTIWIARSVALWCGIVALVLSATGLYSVLAFTVRSRTREIGVRLALGARPADVVILVVRRATLICAAGTAAGLVVALSTWRLLASLLYGVKTFDLGAFVLGPAALMLVAMAASYLPARRAAEVDPMDALRCD